VPADRANPWGRGAFTRRDVLIRGGVAVLGLGAAPTLLGACGGDDATTATSGAGTGGPPSSADVGGALDFLSWEGYDLPDAMSEWKRAHGVEVRATYIASNDDIPAKLAGGRNAGFDLTSAYQGNSDYYRELGILTPISDDAVPNLQNLFPGLRDMQEFQFDGERYAIPFNFGTTVLNYDPAFATPKRWSDLLEPKYKGKVLVVDDPTVNFQLVGHLLGLDVPNFTEADFSKVTDLMSQFIAQARRVSPSYGDVTQALVSGEGAAFFAGWAAMDLFAADAGKKVESVLPEEGSFSYCNGWAIPPDADNRDTALAWINATLEDDVQAGASAALSEGVVTAGAVELLDPKLAALYPYDDLEALLAKAPFYDIAPRESGQIVTYDRWLEAWQELKV
jgi:spermidine/putrescine transport system substrate-binding protein